MLVKVKVNAFLGDLEHLENKPWNLSLVIKPPKIQEPQSDKSHRGQGPIKFRKCQGVHAASSSSLVW